jgi:hypothetical protein
VPGVSEKELNRRVWLMLFISAFALLIDDFERGWFVYGAGAIVQWLRAQVRTLLEYEYQKSFELENSLAALDSAKVSTRIAKLKKS